MKTGIIVFAHGSSLESANESVRRLAREVACQDGFDGIELIEAAFLESGKPDLSEAAARMWERGVRRIVVVPYFLTLGVHLQRDLPHLAAQLIQRFADLSLEITDPLDPHPALAQIVRERAQKALECKLTKSLTE